MLKCERTIMCQTTNYLSNDKFLGPDDLLSTNWFLRQYSHICPPNIYQIHRHV